METFFFHTDHCVWLKFISCILLLCPITLALRLLKQLLLIIGWQNMFDPMVNLEWSLRKWKSGSWWRRKWYWNCPTYNWIQSSYWRVYWWFATIWEDKNRFFSIFSQNFCVMFIIVVSPRTFYNVSSSSWNIQLMNFGVTKNYSTLNLEIKSHGRISYYPQISCVSKQEIFKKYSIWVWYDRFARSLTI